MASLIRTLHVHICIISLAILLISIILVFFSPCWWLCRRAVNRRTGKVIWREESHPGTILMASCTTINYLEVASLLIWRWWVIIDDHYNDISTSPYHCHHEYPQNHPHCGNFQDQEVLRTADCVNGTTLPFSLFPSPTTRFTQVLYLNNHPHMITTIIISWWTCSMTTGTNTSWTCRTECPVFLGAPTCLLTGTSWFTTGGHHHSELSIMTVIQSKFMIFGFMDDVVFQPLYVNIIFMNLPII